MEFISNVLDNFPQGGVPKEVTMVIKLNLKSYCDTASLANCLG